MEIRFSVIVPVYNASIYLNKCISSILSQTHDNFEILLIDDGSTDDSLEICNRFALEDSRVHLFHQSNSGIAIARQKGVEKAKGDYLIFVDADDWIASDYCDVMSKTIDVFNADIICCGYTKFFDDHYENVSLTSRVIEYDKKGIRDNIYNHLLSDSEGNSFPLNVWSKAIKTELYRKNQIKNVVINMGEDAASIAPCVFHAERIVLLNNCLYYYRYNPLSVSNGKRVYQWEWPKIRGKHIEKTIDLEIGDLREQHYRSIVLSLYTVTLSQFNRRSPLMHLYNEIIYNLQDPYYDEALRKCRFKRGSKAEIKRILLRYKLIFLIKVIEFIH